MVMIIADDLLVCTDCALIIANGETGQGEDRDTQVAAAQVTLWGDDARGLVLSGEGEDSVVAFATQACGGCGDYAAGERHPAAVLRNAAVGLLEGQARQDALNASNPYVQAVEALGRAARG